MPLEDRGIRFIEDHCASLHIHIAMHCNKFSSLPHLTNNEVNNLQKCLDLYQTDVEVLKLLTNANVDENFFCSFLLQKLNNDLRISFEKSLPGNNYPTQELFISA